MSLLDQSEITSRIYFDKRHLKILNLKMGFSKCLQLNISFFAFVTFPQPYVILLSSRKMLIWTLIFCQISEISAIFHTLLPDMLAILDQLLLFLFDMDISLLWEVVFGFLFMEWTLFYILSLCGIADNSTNWKQSLFSRSLFVLEVR